MKKNKFERMYLNKFLISDIPKICPYCKRLLTCFDYEKSIKHLNECMRKGRNHES